MRKSEQFQGFATLYSHSKTVGRGFESSRPCQEKRRLRKRSSFFNDVCLRQMMLALPMMSASPNDVWLRHIFGKHRFIASETSYIIFAKQIHHIAARRCIIDNIIASLIFLSHPVHRVTLIPYSTASKKYQRFKAIALCNRLFFNIKSH